MEGPEGEEERGDVDIGRRRCNVVVERRGCDGRPTGSRRLLEGWKRLAEAEALNLGIPSSRTLSLLYHVDRPPRRPPAACLRRPTGKPEPKTRHSKLPTHHPS